MMSTAETTVFYRLEELLRHRAYVTDSGIDFSPCGSDDDDILEGAIVAELLEHIETFHQYPARLVVGDRVEVKGICKCVASFIFVCMRQVQHGILCKMTAACVEKRSLEKIFAPIAVNRSI